MAAGVFLDEMFDANVAHVVTSRGATTALRVVQANLIRRGVRDSAQLAYAAAQQLVLVTRNVVDFLRLHEQWTVARDWGLISRPHSGILVQAGLMLPLDWADVVMDLLLHPRCPSLEDQLLLWEATAQRWMADYPYARQRRRVVVL